MPRRNKNVNGTGKRNRRKSMNTMPENYKSNKIDNGYKFPIRAVTQIKPGNTDLYPKTKPFPSKHGYTS